MARSRREKITIGFLIAWLVFWTAGMLIVAYGLARALRGGEIAATLVMLAWLAAAGFGLYAGARKLGRLVSGAPPVQAGRRRGWNDDLPRGPGP